MFQKTLLIQFFLKIAKIKKFNSSCDKTMIENNCDKLKKSPNIFKNLIGAKNHLFLTK